jgi:TonB family protein
MAAAFARSAPERRMSAAFTAAIHAALLAALLTFRPDFEEPAEPARPLAVDLVPVPPPEPPVVEPMALEEAASTPDRRPAGRPDPGSPAKALRQDMDRTLSDAPSPTFPPGPAPGTGTAPDGEEGPGQAGNGAGSGAGGSGSGNGSGGGVKVALEAPHWVTKPSRDQMEQHNPPRAATERVTGTAVLACRIDSRQRARNCRILSEAPRGYGFGTAALATVRLGRISPAMRDGLPAYEAWVRIPVTFRNCGAGEPGCVDSLD